MDGRFLLLLLCFLLSGFAALLYQTAWTREFAFIFGTSEIAVAVVLAGYMGGLALGFAVAARFAPRLRRPVFAYGALELGIALSALAIPFGLRALTASYVAIFQGELPTDPETTATLFRLAGAFLLMLVPTGLMGATLPLLARHAVRSEEQIGPRIGALYAVNTAGAIAGTVCAAFFLLPALGLRHTVWVGATLNGVVFLAAAALSRGGPSTAPPAAAGHALVRRWVLPLMLLSGSVSFSYEVLWTRLLSQMLGGSLYAFATMLSSFLLGITIGSAIGGAAARRVRGAAIGLALSELGVAVFGLAAFLLSDRLPEIGQMLGAGWRSSPLANAPLAATVLLPVATCLGATFPFAVRLVTPDPSDTATATAHVYAWNTVGAIVGAVGTGFVLLPALHFAGTAVLGAAVSLTIAAAVCWLVRPRLRILLAVTGALAAALIVVPVEPPWQLLLSNPFSGTPASGTIRYEASGRSSTVMLLDDPTGFRLYTNGLPESTIVKYTSTPATGREARILGLLPVLLRPETEQMLVIGLGGGVALEGVPPSVAEVDVVELEPEVVAANREVAAERAIDPLANPRTRVVMNDARGALMLAQVRYDAIVSQPSHPWTAGASHLYTREFFELARDRLTPDGVLVQWIGLSFVDQPLLETLLATLTAVFPEVQVYRPHGPALLFAASNAPLDIVAGRPLFGTVIDHMTRNGFLTIEDAAASLVLDSEGARAFAAGAPMNTDDKNLLASRSARLGKGLAVETFTRLVDARDPLPGLTSRLRTLPLVRSLLNRGEFQRAQRLADMSTGVERELAQGWVRAARNERIAASRHFDRALELDPESMEAHAARLVFKLDVPDPDRLPPEVARIRDATELEAARDWAGLAAIDDELAAVGLEHPLYESANRLRSHSRLYSEDPKYADEAIALIDIRLAYQYRVAVQIERAWAAHLAGRTTEAWATLDAALDQARRSGRRRELLERAHALARVLPHDALKARVNARIEAQQSRLGQGR